MSEDGRFARLLKTTFREAGRRYEETRRAYRDGRGEGADDPASDLPRDEEGRVRIVCRRYAEKRSVGLDEAGRPACFDADHPDCQGCAEDVRDGVVETW